MAPSTVTCFRSAHGVLTGLRVHSSSFVRPMSDFSRVENKYMNSKQSNVFTHALVLFLPILLFLNPLLLAAETYLAQRGDDGPLNGVANGYPATRSPRAVKLATVGGFDVRKAAQNPKVVILSIILSGPIGSFMIKFRSLPSLTTVKPLSCRSLSVFLGVINFACSFHLSTHIKIIKRVTCLRSLRVRCENKEAICLHH
jgi:hypothetical protein